MLISHRKKFIFTKTVKTAGTSVESYFEKYCMPEGEWSLSHSRQMYVSEHGIIGNRGKAGRSALVKLIFPHEQWHEHMSAGQIKTQIGNDVWESYFKFSTMRNPFDKLVSRYHHMVAQEKNLSWRQKQKINIQKKLHIAHPFYQAEGETHIERFRSWIQHGGWVNDRDKYMIDNRVCVDYFILFEDIENGIKEVCKKNDIPYHSKQVPRFKSKFRKDDFSLTDYYDSKTIELVSGLYDFEIKKFGYQCP
ncbi:MAG: sulfotransferase family 2 domain-containing protein [Leptospirales bacterium]